MAEGKGPLSVMLIGILSDSHGRTAMTARAVAALRERGADLLLHLGDIETHAVLDELAGHPVRLVFGNCDWDATDLSRYARHLDLTVDHPVGQIVVGERRIVFTHGHLEKPMHQALHEGADYLLHGHTHEVRDERVGRTRIINPGALFRAPRYTVALLDPRRDSLDIIEVAKAVE